MRRNMKNQFFPNRVVWRLDLATGLSREFKLRANGLASLELLSCSATIGMTLQLPYTLDTCANFSGLPVTSHSRVQPRVSASLHNLEHFFTLSHSLLLHDSHLNIGLLIAKIQENLARNKANKMIDKIQPYKKSREKQDWLIHNLHIETLQISLLFSFPLLNPWEVHCQSPFSPYPYLWEGCLVLWEAVKKGPISYWLMLWSSSGIR